MELRVSRRVLITGASIAGNAAAWWLARSGNEVTVVERAPGFRQGGQGVDVQNLGLQVVDLMGMREEIRRRGTGETGMALVRSDNSPFAEFGIGYGLTNEFEILRDDLAKAFYEPASTMAEYRFGDAIDAVDNRQDGAAVTFRSGRQETFDCVVVAEGVGSATREMLFPGENDPYFLDMTIAYFTIPGGPTDSRQARWYPAKGGMSILVRPDRQGQCRVFLMVQGRSRGRDQLPRDQQRAFMRERFENAGWEAKRILDGMDQSEDFYFDELRQARLPRWSNGRVVLTGDAAWCATPLSGMGASLAIIGAYVLAGEMAKTDDLAAAFAGYERSMRPIVKDNPPAPKVIPRLAHPRSAIGLAIHRGVLSALASPLAKRIFSRVGSGSSKDTPLPEYAFATK